MRQGRIIEELVTYANLRQSNMIENHVDKGSNPFVTTMKIIKKGRPQKGWAQEFECTGKGNGGGGCGAVLLVEEGDLYETSSSHYDGSTEYYTTFKCAACGVETDVKVPSNVEPTRRRPRRSNEGGIDL